VKGEGPTLTWLGGGRTFDYGGNAALFDRQKDPNLGNNVKAGCVGNRGDIPTKK